MLNIFNSLDRQPSPVEVFKTHYAELSCLVSDSANRLALAPELFSARLICLKCYNSVTTDKSPKTDMEKGLLLMKCLLYTLRLQPQFLTDLIYSLKKVEAFKSVAEKMHCDLSQIANEGVAASRDKGM